MYPGKNQGNLRKNYCNRVLIGNWYESSVLLEHKFNKFLEQMKKGDLMLARYRKITENLNTPTELTAAANYIGFGGKISLLAPHVPSQEGKKGLLLGGRINANDLNYSQDLVDGCNVVCLTNLEPRLRSTFVITSADYCNREGEYLKYNQEFLLAMYSSLKKEPLYVRYDPDPCPGLTGKYPLYLSKHPVANARWRILPVIKPDISRFEQENTPILVNTDIVVNHCSTNLNLGVKVGSWAMDFHGSICMPLMKTCLNIFKREEPNNIWQVYIPISK